MTFRYRSRTRVWRCRWSRTERRTVFVSSSARRVGLRRRTAGAIQKLDRVKGCSVIVYMARSSQPAAAEARGHLRRGTPVWPSWHAVLGANRRALKASRARWRQQPISVLDPPSFATSTPMEDSHEADQQQLSGVVGNLVDD